MTKQTKKNKGGRPKKVAGTNKYEFDEEKIEMLASKFWNMSEIAAFYDVDESTIRKRFPNLVTKGREKGKARLRDMQLAAAQKGNVSMLIWLGKQYLEQREPVAKTVEDAPQLPDFENKTDQEIDNMIATYNKKNGNGNGSH